MNECIINAFYIYFAIMIAIYITKPHIFFYHNENKCLFKTFGCGKNKTIINIQILSIVLSIFSYFLTRFLISLN